MLNFHGTQIAADDAKFFFVFAPNNSGTTVLSQYVALQLDGYLTKFGNNEGQNVPSVASQMRKDRWNPAQKFEWAYIRSEWEKLAQGKIFVEGSPPNLVRYGDIAETFGHDSSAISMVCSPYQQIGSCMRRYKSAPFDPINLVDLWAMKARHIRDFQLAYPFFPTITYQELTQKPQSVNTMLDIPVKGGDVVGKKGSDAKGISDQSAAAILFMNEQEIDRVSMGLSKHKDLIQHFGFEIMSGAELHAQHEENSHFAQLARKRRQDWEAGKKSANTLGALLYKLRVLLKR